MAIPSTALTLINVIIFLSTVCYVQGKVCNDAHTCKCVTYSFHHRRLTWITSREWCLKNDGDLVSMETREEWNYLKDFIQTLPGLPGLNHTEYYIGLRKDSAAGSWHWLSNNTKVVSAGPGWPWNSGEPTGDGNCVVIYKNYWGKSLFNDLSCNESASDKINIGFICETPVDCTSVNGRIADKQLTTTSPSNDGKCVIASPSQNVQQSRDNKFNWKFILVVTIGLFDVLLFVFTVILCRNIYIRCTEPTN